MSENGSQSGDHVAVKINGHNEKPVDVKKKKFKLSSLFCGGSKSNGQSGENNIDLAKEVNFTEHLMTFAQLEEKFKTSLDNGLTFKDADFRFDRDGPNTFTPPKQTPNWLILLKELTGGFAWIMWLAALGSLIAYFLEDKPPDYILAIVLVATIFITGLWSFKEQRSSGKLFDTFKNMIPQETLVMREGKQQKVPANRLVVGDVVFCKGGERIPADVRILQCEGMKVDNSSLTGEAEPLSRSPEAGHQMPLEAKNIAFFSTSCVDGSGVGLVIATGDNTVMGKIAKLVTNIQAVESPISIEVGRFVRFIACLGISLGVIFLVVCIIMKMSFFEAFVNAIAIIVGNIPEGLLPAMTLALTLTAKRLSQKNCMIKYLEAVETLGSTSTICSDKTGTLTENRMTVEHCYLGNQIVHASHEEDETREDMAHLPVCWQAFQRCAKLCSRATFISDHEDILSRECSGDASESAILRFMESVSQPETVLQYRERFPKIAEKPFSSVYKYQYSVHRNTEKTSEKCAEFFVVMKGAPERIIKLCSTILNDQGETVPITEDDIDAFEFAYRELGSLGERVLAFCDMDLRDFATDYKFNLDEGNDFEVANMRFLGLIAMIDPPRATVPGAVAKCKDAGICIIMVTGDHPITAQAIAKSVGIISVSHRRSTQISLPKIDRKFSRANAASIVVPGDELASIDDFELRDILRDFNEIVFARTSPQQKLRIVENCQYLGRIVAVTGDGVNDSPALKKADIGIAMGITGSDVSKQAADMILLDDNFASIVVGVEEGRKIFDNLKKTISYILAGNCATIYPFLVFLIFGIPVAVTPIMILCICLGTDLIPAISLAYEKAESDIMKLKPRNPQKDHLVTRQLILWSYLQCGIIVTASGYMGFFSRLLEDGFMPWDMWQVRNSWTDLNSGNITNDLGDTYTPQMRIDLLADAQSAYFCSIIVVQWMDVIINKTRRVSIFSQGFGNWFLNFSIVAETAVACILVYVPGLNTTLTFTSVGYKAWLAGVPFFFLLLAYEEGRKYIVRNYPKSFLGLELAR